MPSWVSMFGLVVDIAEAVDFAKRFSEWLDRRVLSSDEEPTEPEVTPSPSPNLAPVERMARNLLRAVQQEANSQLALGRNGESIVRSLISSLGVPPALASALASITNQFTELLFEESTGYKAAAIQAVRHAISEVLRHAALGQSLDDALQAIGANSALKPFFMMDYTGAGLMVHQHPWVDMRTHKLTNPDARPLTDLFGRPLVVGRPTIIALDLKGSYAYAAVRWQKQNWIQGDAPWNGRTADMWRAFINSFAWGRSVNGISAADAQVWVNNMEVAVINDINTVYELIAYLVDHDRDLVDKANRAIAQTGEDNSPLMP